ncbi:MAG: RNA methyltransferase [Ignavibacteriaceae bacterium]
MTKNELKYYSSLLNKKYREEEKKFIAEGKNSVEEGLKNSLWKDKCEIVFYTAKFYEEHKVFIDVLTLTKKCELLKEPEFAKISDTVTPQGIAAVFSKPGNTQKPENKIKTRLVAALENISDPGNVGTIIRNCDWFGITDIVLSTGCADVYNPKTLRSSTGSVFHLNIYSGINLTHFLKKIKEGGYTIICADIHGENIFGYKLNNKSVIVFSNEANGPSKELLNIIDNVITVPKLGKAESLNVAAASAVILAELTK